MTLYLPAYYASLRRLQRGDLTARIASVGIGSGGEPEATELTDPFVKPVTGLVDGEDPRTLLVTYAIAPGDAPEGMVVREIGLLAADGTLLVRRRFTHGIEITALSGLSGTFDLEV